MVVVRVLSSCFWIALAPYIFMSLEPGENPGGYARHAISIDETRKDFALVGWGSSKDVATARSDWMVSKWFAGNHSDIGGSYPSRLGRSAERSAFLSHKSPNIGG